MGHCLLVLPKMVALKYSMLSILVRYIFLTFLHSVSDQRMSFHSRYDQYDQAGLYASCMLLGASPGSSPVLACDVSDLDILDVLDSTPN